MWAYVFGLGAALLFGLGSVIQQRVAFEAPPGKSLKLALLLWLVQQPLWLAGVGTALFGNLLAAAALAAGSVALVQPLLVSRLLFAVPLSAAWGRQRLVARDWLGMVAVSGGLAAFLLIGRPQDETRPGTEILPWVYAFVAIAVLVVPLVALARRLRPSLEAPLLGAGAGMLFGMQSGLMHTAVEVFTSDGLVAMLLTPMTYLVAVTAILGTLLAQSAYEMAPLAASYPALAAVEPLAGIGVGIGVLGGALAFGPLPIAGEVVSLTVMTFGIFLLATSPLVTGSEDAMERRQLEERAADKAEDVSKTLEKVRRDVERGEQERLDEAGRRRLVEHVGPLMTRVEEELASLSALNEEALAERRGATPASGVSEEHRERMRRFAEELCGREDDLRDQAADLADRVGRFRR